MENHQNLKRQRKRRKLSHQRFCRQVQLQRRTELILGGMKSHNLTDGVSSSSQIFSVKSGILHWILIRLFALFCCLFALFFQTIFSPNRTIFSCLIAPNIVRTSNLVCLVPAGQQNLTFLFALFLVKKCEDLVRKR